MRGRSKSILSAEMMDDIRRQEALIHQEVGPLLKDVFQDLSEEKLYLADNKISYLAKYNQAKLKAVINLHHGEKGDLILNKAVMNYPDTDTKSIIYLLKSGADPYLCDFQGQSAINLAEGKPNILMELENYKARQSSLTDFSIHQKIKHEERRSVEEQTVSQLKVRK